MKIARVNTALLAGPSSGGDSFMVFFRRLRSAAFVEIETDLDGITHVGKTTLRCQIPEIVAPIV